MYTVTRTDVEVVRAVDSGLRSVEKIAEGTGFQHLAVLVSCERMKRDGVLLENARGYFRRPKLAVVVRAGDCQ